MIHTFDVRFANDAGLDASLQVDSAGIVFTPRRGPLSWFRRTQHIRAADIRQVYREGESLRVEYAREGAAREVLPIWAPDRDTAARIVAALPTTQTVEVESTPRPPRRKSGRGFTLALICGAGGVFLGVLLTLKLQPEPESITNAEVGNDVHAARVDAPAIQESVSEGDSRTMAARAETSSFSTASPAPAATTRATAPLETRRRRAYWVSSDPQRIFDPAVAAEWREFEIFEQSIADQWRPPPPRARLIREGIVAFMPGDEVYTIAVWQLQRFELDVQQIGSGSSGWWEVTERISNSETFTHPDLYGMRETMLGVSRAWRAGDEETARRLTRLARLYVY